ncbi:MAG: hypothetical protein AB7T27_04340 [Kiritimatiellia bacterium]
MDLSRNIHYVVLKAAGVPFSRRHDFMLNERWTLRYAGQYLKARRCWKELKDHEVRMIRVFSYSRSGTHNYFSRFHYMPSCFVLHENLYETPEDRHQLAAGVKSVRPIDLMALSVFGPYGLQDKNGSDITRIVLPSNRYLEYPCALEPSAMKDDYVVFYMRNFLRMLYSRQMAAEKMGKPRMVITDEAFLVSAKKHLENLKQISKLTANNPERFKLVLHESFCARPEQVLMDSAKFAGIPAEQVVCWKEAVSFFKEGFYHKEKPFIEENALWERQPDGQKRRIGENYNPVPLPSLKRTMSDPVASWMSEGRLKISRNIFGTELTDIWMNDSEITYERGDDDVLAAMGRAARQ